MSTDLVLRALAVGRIEADVPTTTRTPRHKLVVDGEVLMPGRDFVCADHDLVRRDPSAWAAVPHPLGPEARAARIGRKRGRVRTHACTTPASAVRSESDAWRARMAETRGMLDPGHAPVPRTTATWADPPLTDRARERGRDGETWAAIDRFLHRHADAQGRRDAADLDDIERLVGRCAARTHRDRRRPEAVMARNTRGHDDPAPVVVCREPFAYLSDDGVERIVRVGSRHRSDSEAVQRRSAAFVDPSLADDEQPEHDAGGNLGSWRPADTPTLTPRPGRHGGG